MGGTMSGWARFAHRFTQYYRTAALWTPPRLKSREWMFIPFGNGNPLRHKSFSNIEDVRKFVCERPQHSCFYSTAYWKRPHELKMADKDWLGTDLIFDLDGDHLPGVTDRDFPAMIEVIQEQAWSLWNDFLEPDFGFKEDYLQVTFSGHRGFHLHYRDPSYLHLNSESRRELVSHIRGVGVEVVDLFERSQSPHATGWAKRIRKGFDDVVGKLDEIYSGNNEHLKTMEAGLREMLDREGIKGLRSTASIRKLAELMQDKGRRDRVLSGRFQALNNHGSLLQNLIKSDSSVILGSAGETDEVVTIDTRRQIRWPGSLHGKSGMKVTEFPLSRLDPSKSNSFDCLSEGIALSRQEKVSVEIIEDDVVARFDDTVIDSPRGTIIETHEAGATFLVLKKWGRISK
ncbi:MAG: DNA primase small subunit domain-containing protein [Candidatus Poseidoniaceae archaeon]|nr:DNA primase small subunit domain-containing protein [Candidatus Poseidoniaceae archaeon]